VINLLREEEGALRVFLDLLRHERQALLDGDAETLQEITSGKSAASQRLDQIEKRRKDLQAEAGVAPGKAGFETWLAQQAGSSSLHSAWQSLLRLAEQARDLNLGNGGLIALRMQHNQQALAVLLGSGEQTALYGADGQTRTGGAGRSLGAV